MRIHTIKILLSVIAVLVVACCPNRIGRKSDKPLIGTEWHLTELQGHEVLFAADTFNIAFGNDGSLSGIGACNLFTAPYTTTQKGGMDIGTIASTRRFCPNIDAEQAMFKELDDATSYEISGSSLRLYNGKAIRAVFKANSAKEQTLQAETNCVLYK